MKLLAVVLAVISFAATASAQTESAFYKNESQMLTKRISGVTASKSDCLKIQSDRVGACQAFQTKVLENLVETLSALDRWQKTDPKDVPKMWKGKIAYNTLLAKDAEFTRQSWVEKFFNGKWTPPTEPISKKFYEDTLDRALSVANVCKVLTTERGEACTKEMDEFMSSVRSILAVKDKREKARKEANLKEYFDALAEEGNLIVEMTKAQAVVSQKYYP
jgi:hypothetical protein